MAAVQSEGFLVDLKGYLAWSVVVSSVVSVISHRVLGFWRDPGTKEDRVENPVENRDLDIKRDNN